MRCCAPAGDPTGGSCLSQDPGAGPAGRLSGCQPPGSGDESSVDLRPGPVCLEPLVAGRWPAQSTGWLLQTWRTVPFLRVLFFSVAIETTSLLLAGLEPASPGLEQLSRAWETLTCLGCCCHIFSRWPCPGW